MIKGFYTKQKAPLTPLEIVENKLSSKIDSKIDDVKEEVKAISEELKKKLDEELSYEVDEDKIVESVLAKIEIPEPIPGDPGKDGDDADPVDTEAIVQEVLARIPEFDKEALTKAILSQIPIVEVPKIDEDKLLAKFLKKIPSKKGDLKIIQEKIETDPMSVIEEIMKLPDEKFKLKSSQIDGLDQTIRAFQSQLSRGYLHGGGLAKVATDSTLTGDGTTASPLHVAATLQDITNNGPTTTNTINVGGLEIDGVNIDQTYVPYTGATGDVDLGTHSLTAQNIYSGYNAGAWQDLFDYSSVTGVYGSVNFQAQDGGSSILKVGGMEYSKDPGQTGITYMIQRENNNGDAFGSILAFYSNNDGGIGSSINLGFDGQYYTSIAWDQTGMWGGSDGATTIDYHAWGLSNETGILDVRGTTVGDYLRNFANGYYTKMDNDGSITQSGIQQNILHNTDIYLGTTLGTEKTTNTWTTTTGWDATSYMFTCTAPATLPAVGNTYTNNGKVFTFIYANAGKTLLVFSGTGDPTATGTLTRTSGSGTTPITFSANVKGISHGAAGTGSITNTMTYPPTIGEVFKVSLTVSNLTVGNLTVSAGGLTLGTITANGTYTYGPQKATTADVLTLTPTATGARFFVNNTQSYKRVADGDLFVGGNINAGSLTSIGKITNGAPTNLKNYTVATLPTGVRGDLAYVTDALAPAYLVTIVGGGAVVTPVFFDGVTWVAH